MGYRYLLHDKRLPGSPDLVFPARRKVVFVHGCFWHGHRCPRGFRPATNSKFWAAKIDGNKARDRVTRRRLRQDGWQVLEVFECAIKPATMTTLGRRLVAFLESPRQ
jgi:DNA mismatch endonuclease (patch repair protein)